MKYKKKQGQNYVRFFSSSFFFILHNTQPVSFLLVLLVAGGNDLFLFCTRNIF